MYCTYCGHKNEDGAVFCTKCGQKLEVQEKHSSCSGNNKKAAFCGLFVILAAIVAFILWPRKVNYDFVGTFQPCGLAVAEVKGKYGVCDREKKAVLPAKYESVEIREQNEKNALIPVKLDGTMVFLDDKYKKQFKKVEASAVDGYYLVKKGRKYGIVNEQGDSLVDCTYKKIELQNVYADKAKVKLDGKLNYVSLSGKVLYDSAEEENDGCLVKKNKKYGYIAENGEEIIPVEYEKLSVGKRLDNGNTPVEMNDKKNYLDENGKLLYAEVGEFDENDRAVVRAEDGRYVYIDETGEPITIFWFNEVGAYGKNGLAKVKQGDCWGYINYDGLLVVDPIYNEAADFEDKSYALVKYGTGYNFIYADGTTGFEYVEEFVGDSAIAKVDQKYVLVGRKGNILTETGYDFIYDVRELREFGIMRARKDDKFVLLSTDGKELSAYYEDIFDLSDLYILETEQQKLSEEMIKDKRIPFREGQNYGLMDYEGNIIVAPEYSEIRSRIPGFEADYYYQWSWYEDFPLWEKERWFVTFENSENGVIDQNGNTILRGNYENIYSNESYIETIRDSKHGLYTQNGDKVLNEQYDSIEILLDPQTQNKYIKAEKDGKVALFDNVGTILSDFKYDYITWNINNGEIIAAIDEKLTTYTLQGEKILDCPDKDVMWFCKEKNGIGYVWAVNEEKKYGCLDRKGNEIVPFIYDAIMEYEGVVVATINGKVGVMNKEQEWIIPAEYDDIFFYENVYYVEKDEMEGVYDANGNVILPIEYDYISYGDDNGNHMYRKNGRKGVLNANFEMMIPAEYEYIREYKEEQMCYIAEDEHGKYSLFGNEGNILLKEVNWISEPGTNGLLMVLQAGPENTPDICDINGTWKAIAGYVAKGGFHNGLAVVEDWETGLQGYVNTQGELVIDCQYEEATDFSESSGYADVCIDYENEYWVLIDEKGSIVGESSYRPRAEE